MAALEQPLVRKHGSALMHEYNKKMLFNLIRTREALSRAALTRLTRMSPTSIGRIIGSLIEEGLVVENGVSEAGLGRKATLLEVQPDGMFALGVDIDQTQLEAGLVDLQGQVRVKKAQPLAPGTTPQQAAALAGALCGELANTLAEPLRRRIAGVGVSLPGAIDAAGGMVRQAARLGWNEAPLRELLQESCGLPVQLENRGKAEALAENIFGAGRDHPDFFLLHLGTGLGGALVSGGELQRGCCNILGELGHILVQPGGRLCSCGRRGCLEGYASISGIEREAGLPLEEVLQRAGAGDERCRALLDEAVHCLTVWCANLANLYNPPLLLLRGPMLRLWPELPQLLRRGLEQQLWEPARGSLSVAVTRCPLEDAAVLSAASIIFQERFFPGITIRPTGE